MKEALEQYTDVYSNKDAPSHTHAKEINNSNNNNSDNNNSSTAVVGSVGGSGYDNIKMRYLRSLNITIPTKKVHEDNDADAILATSAPIDIPQGFGKRLDDDDSEDTTNDSDDDSQEYISPAVAAAYPSKAGRRRGNTSPKVNSQRFVPPHQLTSTNTGGSGVINHSLPTNYRRRHQMGI